MNEREKETVCGPVKVGQDNKPYHGCILDESM